MVMFCGMALEAAAFDVGDRRAVSSAREPAGASRGRILRVSVVAPMRGEAAHVDALVADLAAQDFEGELEVIVADGRSTDGSVDRLRAAAERHGLAVTILDNPDRWAAPGLNRCIGAARGDLIVRVDCHSRYPPDYVRRCVVAAEETGADNVGGVLVPKGRTRTERAVGCAMESPFGGIHWSRRSEKARVEVDTVPFGAFRADIFRRIGLFDEGLARNQDDEFNLRLRLARGTIVRDPAIRTYYIPRGSLRDLARQYYEYGFWKVFVMRKHGRVASARSLVPGAFVAALLVLAPFAPWMLPAALALAALLGVYLLGALVFGIHALRRVRERWGLLPTVVLAFPTMHFAYGFGMLRGLTRMLLPLGGPVRGTEAASRSSVSTPSPRDPSFRSFRRHPDAEATLARVLALVHEAGNPYFDWFFAGPEEAAKTLETWSRRRSSEIAAERITLALVDEEPVGFFLALPGIELERCRQADVLALLKEIGSDEEARAKLLERLDVARVLFPQVAPDEFYLSKMGVFPAQRGSGLGRALTRGFLAAGREAGFSRFRLDVSADNEPAVRTYSGLGFQVDAETEAAGLRYLVMTRDER